MEGLLGAVGMLFALFLIVAAVSEQILEVFRGTLGRLGITWQQGTPDVDAAVKAATEFLPDDQKLKGQIKALRDVADKVPEFVQSRKVALAKLAENLDKVAGQGTTGQNAAAAVAAMTAEVKAVVTYSERRRFLILRLISIGIAFAVCAAADFDAIRLAVDAFPGGALAGVKERMYSGSQTSWFGIAATAVAASSGSAYWHDQLDRIRALKGVASSAAAVVKV